MGREQVLHPDPQAPVGGPLALAPGSDRPFPAAAPAGRDGRQHRGRDRRAEVVRSPHPPRAGQVDHQGGDRREEQRGAGGDRQHDGGRQPLVAAVLPPFPGPFGDGIHTVAASGSATVVDGMRWRVVPSTVPARLRAHLAGSPAR
jgi:hypothetical protein